MCPRGGQRATIYCQHIVRSRQGDRLARTGIDTSTAKEEIIDAVTFNRDREGINMELIFNLSQDNWVTIIVTFLGFGATLFFARKSLKNELLKFKQTSQVDQMKTIAFDLCDLMYRIKKYEKNNVKLNDRYAEIMNRVLAYASSNAVNIAILGQQLNFNNKTSSQGNFAPLVTLALLISQLKYDASSEIIPADTWFRLRITDYETGGMKSQIEDLIVETVDELNLNKGFYPKCRRRKFTALVSHLRSMLGWSCRRNINV